MDDDLNTADAITDIFNLVKISNTALASGKVSVMALTDARDWIVKARVCSWNQPFRER